VKTLNEIAYNVLNIVRGGRSTNNEHISLEQIKYTILYYRELLVRRDGGSGFQDLRDFEQSIPNLELEETDLAEGSLSNLAVRGLVLKTKKAIPRPLRISGRDGLTSVHSSDFRYVFPVVDPARARWVRFSKFTPTNPRSFYRNGFVYLTETALLNEVRKSLAGESSEITPRMGAEHPTTIEVRGVFADPREAYEVATGEEWDDDSTPFPMSGDIEQRIVQSLLSGEFHIRTNDTDTDMLPDPNGQ
jgi:hypothetical protein